MVSDKQRRRALARAKWERQQAKRLASQRRQHTLQIVGGAAAGVVAVVLIGWGVVDLVQNNNNGPAQVQPSSLETLGNGSTLPSDTLFTPTRSGQTVYSISPGKGTTPAGSPSASGGHTGSTTAHPTTPTTPTATGSAGGGGKK